MSFLVPKRFQFLNSILSPVMFVSTQYSKRFRDSSRSWSFEIEQPKGCDEHPPSYMCVPAPGRGDSKKLCQYTFFMPCQVNGTSLLGATHLEAVRSLRGIGDNLSLLVCDGFDPADVPASQHAAWQASPVATINTSKSQSQESLEHDVPGNERAYEDIRKEIKRQVGRRSVWVLFTPFWGNV